MYDLEMWPVRGAVVLRHLRHAGYATAKARSLFVLPTVMSVSAVVYQ